MPKFRSSITLGLPKPKTETDEKEAQTLEGMRRDIERASRDSTLIRNVLNTARYNGLNGEDTYTMLAWQALRQLEDLHQRFLDFVAFSPIAPKIIAPELVVAPDSTEVAKLKAQYDAATDAEVKQRCLRLLNAQREKEALEAFGRGCQVVVEGEIQP